MAEMETHDCHYCNGVGWRFNFGIWPFAEKKDCEECEGTGKLERWIMTADEFIEWLDKQVEV